LLADVQCVLQTRFNSRASAVLPEGRAGAFAALKRARMLIEGGMAGSVLIAAVDSYLCAKALPSYESLQRVLTSDNSNGFVPGEAASAVLVAPPSGDASGELLCTGIGISHEQSTI